MVELVAVLAILALLTAAAVTRFGVGTLETLGAEGFAQRLALDLLQARRRTIATGDNHYLQIDSAAGQVTGYAMYRRAAGGDVVVEQRRVVPDGVVVTASHATLEFDFAGATLAGYSVQVAGPQRHWTVSTVIATGQVRTVETTL